jgi:hypothetical protein
MRQAAEHDVGHPGHLVPGGIEQLGPVVAMDAGPPAADTIDEFAPIRLVKAGAIGAGDGNWGGHSPHLGVGQPDMGQAFGEPVFRVCHDQPS